MRDHSSTFYNACFQSCWIMALPTQGYYETTGAGMSPQSFQLTSSPEALICSNLCYRVLMLCSMPDLCAIANARPLPRLPYWFFFNRVSQPHLQKSTISTCRTWLSFQNRATQAGTVDRVNGFQNTTRSKADFLENLMIMGLL